MKMVVGSVCEVDLRKGSLLQRKGVLPGISVLAMRSMISLLAC